MEPAAFVWSGFPRNFWYCSTTRRQTSGFLSVCVAPRVVFELQPVPAVALNRMLHLLTVRDVMLGYFEVPVAYLTSC